VNPLAYHLTWTAYGQWLSGDERGWVDEGKPGIQPGDKEREDRMRARMSEQAVTFDAIQREMIETTIRDHCRIRGWEVLALTVRPRHVHLVVGGNATPERMMEQLKAWCSRRLSDAAGLVARVAEGAGRRRWFTEHGSTKWINDQAYLDEAIDYVLHRQ
jgi:REP element-mobilizing transposase RayT